MKKNILLISCILISTIAFGQNRITLKAAKDNLFKQVDSLRKHKPLDDYNGQWVAKLEKEFYLDTLYIERLWALELDYNSSTQGIAQANYNAENHYDTLLNKYYNKLINRMVGKDKEVIKESQRNWIKFRNSERIFNNTIQDEQYSDGGTIHTIFATQKFADITRQRVIELYYYLDRIWRPMKK